jgi:hypothetical protein
LSVIPKAESGIPKAVSGIPKAVSVVPKAESDTDKGGEHHVEGVEPGAETEKADADAAAAPFRYIRQGNGIFFGPYANNGLFIRSGFSIFPA